MKKKKSKWWLLCAISILAFQQSAFSFDWNGFDVKPRGSVTGVYDDNIAFTSTDEIDDFITRFTAGIGLSGESKLTELDLNANIHYDLFTSNDDLSNTWGDVNADWQQEINEYNRFRIRDNYIHSDEPRTFEEAFVRTPGRYTFQRNTLDTSFTHDFSSRWDGTLKYGNEFTDVESGARSRDSQYHTGGAETGYQVASFTRVLGEYAFKNRDFSAGNDATINELNGGIRQDLTERTYVEGRVGVSFIDAYNDDSLTEPLFRVRLVSELDKVTTLNIAFEKEHGINPYVEDIFDHWQVSGALNRELSRRLSARLSGFYGEGDYVASDRSDELWGVDAGLTYDIRKNLKGVLQYGHLNTSSNIQALEFTRNTLLVGLVLEF